MIFHLGDSGRNNIPRAKMIPANECTLRDIRHPCKWSLTMTFKIVAICNRNTVETQTSIFAKRGQFSKKNIIKSSYTTPNGSGSQLTRYPLVAIIVMKDNSLPLKLSGAVSAT